MSRVKPKLYEVYLVYVIFRVKLKLCKSSAVQIEGCCTFLKEMLFLTIACGPLPSAFLDKRYCKNCRKGIRSGFIFPKDFLLLQPS